MSEAEINPQTGNLDKIGISQTDIAALDARYIRLDLVTVTYYGGL